VVPFRYRDQNFVNALQWAIGLEIFLLVEDPWRIFLTTDHPNGAPFTSYPHLIRLLMDKSFRDEKLAGIDPVAASMSTLGSINREYSLYEIAILTRAAPARTLGMKNMGHLSPGAVADVVVYREDADREAMFTAPELVFRRGQRVVKNGRIEQVVWGDVHVVKPDYDRGIEQKLQQYHQRYQTISPARVRIADDEIPLLTNGGGLQIHRCSRHGGES
jgi:formylmethanofuran dehydrogenase subunit A